MSNTKVKWEQVHGPLGGTNCVLSCDEFYISFNPDLNATIFGSIFESDNGGCETALCKDDNFYILNGDYRIQYEKLFTQGFNACKRFYDQQSAYSDSSWSDRDDRHTISIRSNTMSASGTLWLDAYEQVAEDFARDLNRGGEEFAVAQARSTLGLDPHEIDAEVNVLRELI